MEDQEPKEPSQQNNQKIDPTLDQMESIKKQTKQVTTSTKDKKLKSARKRSLFNLFRDPLIMQEFDYEYVKDLAVKVVNKVFRKKLFKAPDKSYGIEQQKSFAYRESVLQTTLEICKKNGWTSRTNWREHKVPMNQIMKEYLVACRNYADILRYYKKVDFDRRSKDQFM